MMINWIKDKWQENIFHKIWIFAVIWILIFFALWMTVAFIGAILYAWYYYPSVNFKNWFSSIFENWVTETSFGVSFLIFMGCLFYYFYINFEKWNPKNSKLKNETKSQVKEFKKLGSTNLINLNKKVGLVKSKLNQHTGMATLFSKEKRSEIIQQKPELKSKVAEVAKLIGNHWKEMTSEQKDKYVKMAEENKKIYENEIQK